MKIYLLRGDSKSMLNWIKQTKADPYSFEILNNKCSLPLFFIKSVRAETANIIKQTALSVGCDCSVGRGVISGEKDLSDMMVMCTKSQLKKIKEKLKGQPFSLEKIADAMVETLDLKDKFFVRGADLLEKDRFVIMGILNLTKDSFYDGGSYRTVDDALKKTEQMLNEGAKIIDVGGESSRPGSEPVEERVEIERVMPFLKKAIKRFEGIIFSLDTYKSNIAEAALKEGVSIINDISGLRFDKRMSEVIAKERAACILMHMKGSPKSMQDSPYYENPPFEVTDYLEESVDIAEKAGIDPYSISVDPGIGFGKTKEHNLDLLKNIDILRSLGKPVCVGVSNKRFIGSILDVDEKQRVLGTVGANTTALLNGARIFRVHNVRENYQALKVAEEILYAGD